MKCMECKEEITIDPNLTRICEGEYLCGNCFENAFKDAKKSAAGRSPYGANTHHMFVQGFRLFARLISSKIDRLQHSLSEYEESGRNLIAACKGKDDTIRCSQDNIAYLTEELDSAHSEQQGLRAKLDECKTARNELALNLQMKEEIIRSLKNEKIGLQGIIDLGRSGAKSLESKLAEVEKREAVRNLNKESILRLLEANIAVTKAAAEILDRK